SFSAPFPSDPSLDDARAYAPDEAPSPKAAATMGRGVPETGKPPAFAPGTPVPPGDKTGDGPRDKTEDRAENKAEVRAENKPSCKTEEKPANEPKAIKSEPPKRPRGRPRKVPATAAESPAAGNATITAGQAGQADQPSRTDRASPEGATVPTNGAVPDNPGTPSGDREKETNKAPFPGDEGLDEFEAFFSSKNPKGGKRPHPCLRAGKIGKNLRGDGNKYVIEYDNDNIHKIYLDLLSYVFKNNLENPGEPSNKLYLTGKHKELVMTYYSKEGENSYKLLTRPYNHESMAGLIDINAKYVVKDRDAKNDGAGKNDGTPKDGGTPKNGPKPLKSGHIPDRVVKRFLAQLPEIGNEIPFLHTIVYAPGITPDGTVMAKPGYYPKHGVIFDPLGEDYPTFPESVTKEEALRSLERIRDITRDFPWSEDYVASESVALAALMTPLIRPYVPMAPVFLITSDRPNTGKSLLADIVSILNSGDPASYLNISEGKYAEEHMEKRIIALADNNARVICLDNVGETPRSNALCSFLTQECVQGHVLYSRREACFKNLATYLMTGNNVLFSDDLAERAYVAVLKNPGRAVNHRISDLRAHARKHRAEICSHAIRIIKGYLDFEKIPDEDLSEEDAVLRDVIETLPESERFGRWAKLTRNPLIWLGMPDPLLNHSYVEENDVMGLAMDLFKEAWFDLFETNPYSINEALKHPARELGNPDREKYENFVEACEYAMVTSGRKVDLVTKGSFSTNIARFIHKHDTDGQSALTFRKLPWRGRYKYSLVPSTKSGLTVLDLKRRSLVSKLQQK
ncbi:MAG: hypothetical protein LBF41_04420, partial [Deltaproteobacteria bacterium]|nr:hypothetical protein [Deltaproteobacteria bacterium]